MWERLVLMLLVLAWALPARAQQGEVIEQQLDADRHGHTVLKVWGTDHEMGFAQGFILAEDILAGLKQLKDLAGAQYLLVRLLVNPMVWEPPGLVEEIDGIVAGVKAAVPDAEIDAVDVKAFNTVGDWGYITVACRSHSAWGAFVGGATRTLSSRRLDFSLPSELTAVRHHVMVARQPSDPAAVRWVNLAWPGFAVAITGVNEFGTQAALHDHQSKMVQGAHMPRCVATRHALTMVAGIEPARHLDTVFAELKKYTIMTGTFITYFVPEGHGGVLTCAAGEKCSGKRVPQPGYFDGQVLITTNDQTDGLSAPPGGEPWHDYYAAGGVKTLADHYASLEQGLLVGAPPIHRMSVDYRARGEMTIWAAGLLAGQASTPVIKVEFADLFADTPARDAGVADGQPGDAAPDAPDSGVTGDDGTVADAGCGCETLHGSRQTTSLLGLVAAVWLLRRRRCRSR